jgi:hypothetical protein
MKRAAEVFVKKSETEPETTEILASAITNVSESLTRLRKSGLNERAILALVKDDTGLSKACVKRVLDSLGSLRRMYTT